IISEVKYAKGTTDLKIIAPKPYKKDRLNFFKIDISGDTSITKSVIRGFLQVKKGSHYNADGFTLPPKAVHELKYHLKKTTFFDRLDINGDYYGIYLRSLVDTAFSLYPAISDDAKLLTLMQTNGRHLYNFFNVPKGASSLDVDMTQINKTSLVKNITSPGTNLSVQIFGRPDKKYFNSYNLGQVTSLTSGLNYYYPQESFDEYVTEIGYTIGKSNYFFTKNTSTIPDKADTYDAVINTPASNLTTFKPSFSGNVDYYEAHFSDNPTPNLFVLLFAPAAANYNNIKFPDFSKYLGVKSVDLTKQVLTYFCIYQDGTFDEKNFLYKSNGRSDYPSLNLRSVSRSY
ncbi:MAG: hypothetical protein AAGC65_11365, partial [Mucilaginibacter sp.]|uniref:hypothetical protein n=1 Tax=Mucilaginibacter sp. TaxID=1882438 RepID=UPI0031A79832